MMLSKRIVAAALVAASAVAARNITVCEDPNYVSCYRIELEIETCVPLAITTDTASSLDTGTLTCDFFVDFDCVGISGSFQHTGKIKEIAVEPGVGEQFDNAISSLRCR
ncbi:uncharacterized protein L3040_004038 [Drepanopeziza brunnea f. sp. 'multigermtubi']|uniref:uncharacterized protein n=1 Tax=Drepanopeziza brunnea f. sp. 'multigermtubi' TaxID=698441 RepID=UPI0023984133|nr:hypothetical protein L3040_004038 [Drepanopeziza brunnea f. sp. 'multigermtubi']